MYNLSVAWSSKNWRREILANYSWREAPSGVPATQRRSKIFISENFHDHFFVVTHVYLRITFVQCRKMSKQNHPPPKSERSEVKCCQRQTLELTKKKETSKRNHSRFDTDENWKSYPANMNSYQLLITFTFFHISLEKKREKHLFTNFFFLFFRFAIYLVADLQQPLYIYINNVFPLDSWNYLLLALLNICL
jgi:hypothetical protein